MTSGGTESILCAVAAYRDRARRERPWIRRPELVVPSTIHPAFDKAAHYFGVGLRKVAVGDDLRADVAAMTRAIGRRTIGLVASAPQYPHGDRSDRRARRGLPGARDPDARRRLRRRRRAPRRCTAWRGRCRSAGWSRRRSAR